MQNQSADMQQQSTPDLQSQNLKTLNVPSDATQVEEVVKAIDTTNETILTITITPDEIDKLDLQGTRTTILQMISSGNLLALLEDARLAGKIKKFGPPTELDISNLISENHSPNLRIQLELLLQLTKKESELNQIYLVEAKLKSPDKKTYKPSQELQGIRIEILTMINNKALAPFLEEAKKSGKMKNRIPTPYELAILANESSDPIIQEELATLLELIQTEEALSTAELANL